MIRDPVCGEPVDEKGAIKVDARGRTYYFCSEYNRHVFLDQTMVAYFSMEIGLTSDMHTYSGGLGILAGDVIKTSAELRIPIVGVSLVSKKGYLRQEITPDGKQIDHTDEWEPANFMKELPTRIALTIQGRRVNVKGWMYEFQNPAGGMVPVIFLDTDVEGNANDDKEITSFLYGGDETYRLKQEIVLGIGGVKMLDACGFKIRKYHMNEGHSSLLTLELLRRNDMDADRVKDLCIFTTHTPVEAAHDKFSYDMVSSVMGELISIEELKKLGDTDALNMTSLALNLSRYVNGVSEEHMAFSNSLFPSHHISAITNGVHSYSWTCESFRKLYDKYIPGWPLEPARLVRVVAIPGEEIWLAHMEAKDALISYVKERTKTTLDRDVLTLGFARRATAYKRPTLLFSDMSRLRGVKSKGNIQMIFAGKAHPNDLEGKRLIEEIYGYMKELNDKIKVVYLENYDMDVAARITSGVDLWLNTPMPPLEASGTSGMKAAHNGVTTFSVLDGWWVEGWIEDVTGWAIGPIPAEKMSESERRMREKEDLYSKLEYVIIPKFYDDRDGWIHMMRNSIGKVAYYFNSHRMMMAYATEAYM